jgi:hypothetical protein
VPSQYFNGEESGSLMNAADINLTRAYISHSLNYEIKLGHGMDVHLFMELNGHIWPACEGLQQAQELLEAAFIEQVQQTLSPEIFQLQQDVFDQPVGSMMDEVCGKIPNTAGSQSDCEQGYFTSYDIDSDSDDEDAS